MVDASSGRAPVCANPAFGPSKDPCSLCGNPLSLHPIVWKARICDGPTTASFPHVTEPPTASAPPRTEAPETLCQLVAGCMYAPGHTGQCMGRFRPKPSPSADTGGAAGHDCPACDSDGEPCAVCKPDSGQWISNADLASLRALPTPNLAGAARAEMSRAELDVRWYADKLCKDVPERYEVYQTREGRETPLSESCRVVLATLASLRARLAESEQAATTLADFAETAPGRLPGRVQEAIAVTRAALTREPT